MRMEYGLIILIGCAVVVVLAVLTFLLSLRKQGTLSRPFWYAGAVAAILSIPQAILGERQAVGLLAICALMLLILGFLAELFRKE